MNPPVLRVLVVDDNADLRRLIGVKLGVEEGLHVVGEAGNGAIALEMAAALSPDVVVLDLSMPVMDGLETLPPLRRLLPESRIVVLSGFEARTLRDQVKGLGADEYLEKGAPLDGLVDLIRGLSRRDAQVIDLTDRPAPSERG